METGPLIWTIGNLTEIGVYVMQSNDLEICGEDLDHLAGIAIGLEDSGDISRAIALYKIGIELGDLTCMTRLADILSDPPGFVNLEAAERLYKRACVAGHAPACRNLAIMYNQLGKSDLYSRYMKLAKSRGDVWQEEEE